METIIKTPTIKPLVVRKGIRFRSMIAYIHSYFRFICELQTKANGLSQGDRFRVMRTKSAGCDTHVFTGDKYTILITIRQNEPEKGA
ncbi:hypothetical protein [Dysgonomonas gadei]|uniref:hypothetical protein n=1 Tax=Dysgonomonas gadei TaxID=156974 RepID=UPI003AF118CC